MEASKNYPKKQTSHKIADMLYIYDYVQARQSFIKESNQLMEMEYQKNTSAIDTDKDLNTAEKKAQYTQLKIEKADDTIDTKIEDIFKDIEETASLKIKANSISKLYYSIKPYIDDLKYKEFIMGKSLKL